MQDGSLDPRKNVHLRPGNNPFSIFSGNGVDDVPDIFADAPTGPAQRKAAPPVLVPSMRADDGFSLLPAVAAPLPPTLPMAAAPVGGKGMAQTPSKNGPIKVAAAVAAPVPTNVVLPAVALQQPPPPPPLLHAAQADDDSFFDEDDDVLPVVGGSGGASQDAQRLAAEKRRVAELELRLAQTNMELVGLRDRLKGKDDEVAQLQGTLAQAKRKEREDNKALEAALGAIEAKLEAAVARANAAEAEAAGLRARIQQLEALGGGEAGSEAARLREANKSLRRVVKQAANMSLDFGDAATKSAESIRALIAHANTLQRLGALLGSLEKVVVVDEGND